MSEIKHLDQQVINQIAAGEVVERPASVVKELMENAIDAGATQIDVIIEDGGLSKIEIRDNGKGISKDDLPAALERYATSKLATAEDLESITTYGFRGEALAAISSVSKTIVLTTRDGETYSVTSDNGTLSGIVPGSRSQGTTITIEKLFGTIPARQKFLKSSDTEYKYILKIFTQFALLNGDVHFTLTNDGKSVYTFPSVDSKFLPKERVAKVYNINVSDLLEINHEEYGIRVHGFLVHPKLLGSTSKFLVSFINKRPVEDKGIYRAMQQGIAEFVPDFFKPSGIVSVSLSPEQVDVNVHPRKTEVKLINPFRVYAAVTHAVKASLQTNITIPNQQIGASTTSSFSQDTNRPAQWERKQEDAYSRLRGSQPQFFFEGTREENPQRAFGSDDTSVNLPENSNKIPEFLVSEAKINLSEADITPILGRYIIVGFMDEVWVVDQHAAAERIRYEQFRSAYLDGKNLPKQHLLVPIELSLSQEESIVLTKHLDVLIRLGFDSTLMNSTLVVSAVPTYLQKANLELLLRDTIAEFVDHDDLFLSPVIEDFSSEKSLSLIIATMACHNSVRMNERLSVPEAKSIMSNLLECKVPYACPHGRRIVWRLSKEEVDRQFMRT